MEIRDYPDYLIYDDGRVWSKPRKDSIGRRVKGRFLKHNKNHDGYHQVQLYRDGKRKHLLVSRLVAEHYIPNPEDKPQVDHKNRDIDNNNVSNLRWATGHENAENKGMNKTNTSGHKGICYDNTHNRWKFLYRKRGYNVQKYFKTKTEALCAKFFFLLKLKSTERVDALLTTGI